MQGHEITLVAEKAVAFYEKGELSCAEAVFYSVNECLHNPLPAGTVCLASGFSEAVWPQAPCGALMGALMALGLTYGRMSVGGRNVYMESLGAGLVQEFQDKFGTDCCRVHLQGKPLDCAERVFEATKMVLKRF